jgi:hypothetical protein
MDYLKELFHESLNDEGIVEVAGYPFYRDVILRELESEGYKEVFTDWLARRREDNLARAEEILAQFDNRKRFVKIQELYKRGAIIPFVGAGMSMSSGYPSWTSFLYEILNDTKIPKEAFDILISNGEYEEAAQLLFDNLPHGTFLERVENTFDEPLKPCGSVQRLPLLFKSAVITTNFDNVLKKCFEDAAIPFEEELKGADAKELPRQLGQNKRTLVKLHGTANTSRDRILTKSEYDRHYSNSSTLKQVIEAISSKTLLFLGCSLTIDRTVRCLAEIMQEKGIDNLPRHYAFLKINDGDDRLARRDQLAAANIYPIWYTEDHDECIEALLEKLAEGAEQ